MNCKKCKCALAPDAVYCENCGARVRKNAKKAEKEAQPLPPEALVPLTTGQSLCILLAFCVPVANLILMLIWAYAPQGNENRRSMARAGLILFGIALLLAILGLSVFLALLGMGVITVTGVI